jgi:hypothetical protein
MAPAPPDCGDCPEGRPIGGGGLALGLGGHQAHLFPLSWTAFPPPRPWHRANHRTVGLGHDVAGALRRQAAKALLILLFQMGLDPGRVTQGDLAHPARRQLQPIVLLHPLRGLGKGMLRAKVTQRSLQALRTASGPHANPRGKDPPITALPIAPNPFLDFHLPKDAPPFQPFFLPQ